MKLRNKKTGEIIELELGNYKNPTEEIVLVVNHEPKYRYTSLAELNEEWEDYEEPKEFWYIGQDGVIFSDTDTITQDYANRLQAIGNYFETEEEAEKAVEKLKAWKRLKDKGFRFEGIKEDYTRILQSQVPFRTGKRYLQFNKSEDGEWMKENWNDLDLLFGDKNGSDT